MTNICSYNVYSKYTLKLMLCLHRCLNLRINRFYRSTGRCAIIWECLPKTGNLSDKTIYIYNISFSKKLATIQLKWGGGVGVTAVILVRTCGPTFQNPSHSYTWALQIGTHSYTYRIKLPPIKYLFSAQNSFLKRISLFINILAQKRPKYYSL